MNKQFNYDIDTSKIKPDDTLESLLGLTEEEHDEIFGILKKYLREKLTAGTNMNLIKMISEDLQHHSIDVIAYIIFVMSREYSNYTTLRSVIRDIIK